MMALVQWQSPHLIWLTTTALFILLMITAWFYRTQFWLTPSRSVWLLPVLRVSALAALLLSVLRPVIVSAINDQQRGIVAVLVDQSRSMSVIDRGRSPAQLVQLAAALGALPSQARPTNTSELRQQVTDLRRLVDDVDRAVSELEYARLSGRGIESAEDHLRNTRIVLSSAVRPIYVMAPENLSNMIGRIDTAETDRLLHVERVLEELDSIQSAADELLYENNSQVRATCDSLAGLSRIELARKALDGEAGLIQSFLGTRPAQVFGFSQSLAPLRPPLDEIQADGDRTDLQTALSQLKQALSGQRVSALVILSDGRNVPSDGLEPIGWTGTPIFAVTPFGEVGRDLAIANIAIPREVLIDQAVNVDVELSAVGFEGQAVRVTLDGAGVSQSRDILIREGAGRGQIPVTFHTAGPQPISILVEPEADEATIGNNGLRRIVKVISSRLRVMLLAGSISADYQNLGDALRGDSSLVVASHVLGSGPTQLAVEQFADQDVVIITDVPADSLDAEQWDALNQLVTRGGSLIFITGDPKIAASYATNSVTAAMLPYRAEGQPVAHVWPGPEPVYRIVPAGSSSPLRLDDSPEQRVFNLLPPLHRFLSSPLLRVGASPVLIERESGLPVLTELRLGQGRVLFLGLSDLTSWRDPSGVVQGDWFWLNLVHAAAQSPYAVTGDGLWFDADSLRIEPGQAVHLRARISPRHGGSGLEPPMIQVRRGDESVTSISLRSISGFNDRFEATLDDLAAGNYDLRLTADGSRALSLPLRVEQSDEIEMRDISGDETELQRIAGAQGEVIPLDQVQTLPQLVARVRDTSPRFVERRMWDSPQLFLFVLGCLGLEWALRKRAGLT